VNGRGANEVSLGRLRREARRRTPVDARMRGDMPTTPGRPAVLPGSSIFRLELSPPLVGARRLGPPGSTGAEAILPAGVTVWAHAKTWNVLANTVMDLTATFAACAALPRTCFRMSAAHHHVRHTEHEFPGPSTFVSCGSRVQGK